MYIHDWPLTFGRSWSQAYNILSDPARAIRSNRLKHFLESESAVAILRQWLRALEPPTAASRAQNQTEYKTKTAGAFKKFRLDAEIGKQAVEWLVQQTQLDELGALRIAILEKVGRPAALLTGGKAATEAQSLDLHTDALGATSSGIPQDKAGVLTQPHKSRLLRIYLQERLAVVRTGDLLRRLDQDEHGYLLGDRDAPEWLITLSKTIQTQDAANIWSNFSTLLDSCQFCVERLQRGSGWFADDGGNVELESLWTWTSMSELNAMFQSAFHLLQKGTELPPASAVSEWFHFVAPLAFFKDITPANPGQVAATALLQSLTALVSLSLLRIDILDELNGAFTEKNSVSALEVIEGGYFSSIACINDLQQIFLESTQYGPSPAAPALLAWAMMAVRIRELVSMSQAQKQQSIAWSGGYDDDRGRRVSFSAEPDSAIERVSNVIKHSLNGASAYEALAAGAVDECQAHEVIATLSNALESALAGGVDNRFQRIARFSLLHLLDSTASLTGYSSPLVGAAIAVVGGKQRSWSCAQPRPETALQIAFIQPDLLVERLEAEALSRSPFELVPFLRLSKLSCQLARTDDDDDVNLIISSSLQATSTFTQVLPAHFRSYDLPREDEDSSFVRLTDNLPLFHSRRKIGALGQSTALATRGSEAAMIIPKGTQGVAIRDGRPLVVIWQHQHSGWQYLTNWLATAVAGCEWYDTANGAAIGLDEASEILALFASWLHTALWLAQEAGRARAAKVELDQLLSSLRDGFHPTRDFINVVLDVFEQQLQNHPLSPGLDGSSETLTNATLLLAGVAQVAPGRVWAHLAGSQLLDHNGTGGALVAVVEATEMVTGQYDFLIACIRLYDVLVEDAVCNVIARKAKSTTRRFAEEEPSVDAIQDRTISTILLSFTRTLTGLFASSGDWRFASLDDKAEIDISLMRVFSKVLKYTYGFDDVSGTKEKLTAVLGDSSQHLVDTFLSASGSDTTPRPVFQVLTDVVSAPLNQLSYIDRNALIGQAREALALLRALLRLSTLLDLPMPALERTLLQSTSTLAQIFVTCYTLRKQVADLLTAIVENASRTEKEPASLLGRMGESDARSFLSVLVQDARSSEDELTRIAVWQLLSAVVSCRQQWFATYLLTGTTPKESLAIKAGNPPANTQQSLFSSALDIASDVSASTVRSAISILKFILLSQNYWPRVIRGIRNHPRFIDGILSYLSTLKRNPREREPRYLVQSCYETRLAGFIGEILAMCVHHLTQSGDYTIAEKVTSRLAYFREFGVAPPKYNTSLHINLEKNLESKYPGCRLHSFRKTDLIVSDFGEDYCYDIEFAAKLLDFDSHWSHEQSLRKELPLANVDLSMVEAQIELLSSWKLLATELSTICDQVKKVQPLLVGVIQKCLDANSSNDNPPVIYDRLVQTRADFSFTLLQRLLNSSQSPAELQPILTHVWDAIRTSGVNFDAPFIGASSHYYRSLLKILYLALKPHAAKLPKTGNAENGGAVRPPSSSLSKHISPTTTTILEILERIICLGFRSLASQLHESSSSTNPSDFVLTTALFQSILSVQDIDAHYQQLVMIFTSTGVVRYATSLFSWAEQLTVLVDGQHDPIYGELSILFLLELSTVQLMAETMAVEGILAQLTSAHICQYFSQGKGMGPFDNPPRLYAIWSKGLLPLCLNLLGAVGAPIAAEVAAFLNQFAPQMAKNAANLESRPPKKPSSSSVRGAAAVAGPFPGAITLGIAAETHNLALIAYALDQAREAGASEGVVSSDIPQLEWDRAGVKEDLQVWLSGRRGLADRIVATNDAEEAMIRSAPLSRGTKSENKLEERIVQEFEGALLCLGEENGNGKAS